MGFYKCFQLCNHHHNQDIELFHCLEVSLYFLQSVPFTHTESQAAADLSSICVYCGSLDLPLHDSLIFGFLVLQILVVSASLNSGLFLNYVGWLGSV